MADQQLAHSVQTTNLADILERVLDKGIVIAGDIRVYLVGVELLDIKLRLMVASIDKAMEMGINWWQSDPYLNARSHDLEEENKTLRARLERLEPPLETAPPPSPAHAAVSMAETESAAASI